MNINELPTAVRTQYLKDKEEHDTYCDEGYIVSVSYFDLGTQEKQCPYCQRFNKELFDD
jgi:hypothetical protein